jgi:hypothetical protein
MPEQNGMAERKNWSIVKAEKSMPNYHFIRERVLSSEVKLQHVPTDQQIADIFTKPLGLDKLRQFSGALGLRHLNVLNLRGRVEPKPNKLETANLDSESRIG